MAHIWTRGGGASEQAELHQPSEGLEVSQSVSPPPLPNKQINKSTNTRPNSPRRLDPPITPGGRSCRSPPLRLFFFFFWFYARDARVDTTIKVGVATDLGNVTRDAKRRWLWEHSFSFTQPVPQQPPRVLAHRRRGNAAPASLLFFHPWACSAFNNHRQSTERL